MAFGFGFNKQKVLSTAEKNVQQGKLQNAISEYEKILKADPKDLTVMNTVGDLHSRLGQTDKAVECFKSVGDAYAAQGFTVKAIAMYKKLSKLKPSLDCVLRLAELYTQQGLFNDARTQYKQVAEEFLRTGDLDQAIRIFQKILEMDPENIGMRTKLAEVYLRLGKKTEAWQIFSSTAESLCSRGAASAAEEIVQRMLAIDPSNSVALLLRGRIAFESGDIAGAIQRLEKVADLDSHADGLRTLMQAYVRTGRLSDAGTLAGKLLTVHNDVSALAGYAETLLAAGRYEDALQVYEQHSEPLLQSNQAKALETLHNLIGHVRGNTTALESVLALLIKAGENTHLTEVYELLAHSSVQSGELEKARDYYLRLTQLEPQNQLHARNYQQVVARLGDTSLESSSFITAEEGATLVDELEATAPFIDQRYADDVALAVRAALTDAELFASYNMPAKAMGPLVTALEQAPQDLRLNQRLAALHTRAGRFAEAAVCCRTLGALYHDAGHPDEASRYGELAGKYEARASIKMSESIGGEPMSGALSQSSATGEVASAAGAAEAAPSTPAVSRASGLFWHPRTAAPAPLAPAKPAIEIEAPSTPAAAQSEIDISAEWEGTISDEPSSISTPEISAGAAPKSPAHKASADATTLGTIAATIEEIRFYVAQSMVEHAQAALARLKQLGPNPASLSLIEKEVAAAASSAPVEPAEEVSIEQIDVGDVEAAAPVASEPEIHVSGLVPAAHHETAPPAESANLLGAFVADLEDSLGGGFVPASPKRAPQPEIPPSASLPQQSWPAKPEVTASAPPPPAARAAAASVGDPATPSAFTYQPRPLAPAAATSAPVPSAPANLGVDIAGMFGELREELEEGGAAPEEDSETHYNLGVAFREMGLLDEAIGEFQKVCQAADHGHAFPQLMQAYTWLAQCFLDKGVPEAAIRWYEKALHLPALDAETRTALHYELACSYELANDKPLALKHFLEVYGNNIDYRDVAERIRALKS